ncbi:MAG: capsule biosynthesis protein [Bacteroidetes bacterium B1(2017)]|nr:MAG: capsule biosynthesis protein [Bacteroidetes bacterium B1(2017)]
MLLLVFVLIGSNKSYSQNSFANSQNLSSLRVDDLSDQQVITFKKQFLASGYSEGQLEEELIKRKLPPSELDKLQKRLLELETKGKLSSSQEKSKDTEKTKGRTTEGAQNENPFEALSPKIFGSELFNNPKLSFEPNLKMATPLNYQLGPDDELLIDIFGFSEQSFQLRVSPEGHVRIPNLGPVQVAGLTVEQAQIKIRSQLVKLYPRIASGETSVSVNLGSIRNIKVIILGEVNLPGTYSLPSLATVFNALYSSGGPNLNGSFRNIKVYRGNKLIAKIDMYDFLINGNSKGNIALKDQDVIKVEPYENRVEVSGFVKREGLYEVLPKDNLNTLLSFAGGFKSNAYTNRIKVIRNTGTQKSVADIEKASFGSFIPKNGDMYTIDSALSRFENRISIEGAVFRPGYYSLEGNTSLKKLIANAEGLKEDAFMTRATILRKKADNTMEVVSVDLNEVVNGSKDLELKREDLVSIASKISMQEKNTITINGPVMNPGVYAFADNMRIEDLIVIAGGLKESASLINILVAQRSFNVDKANPTGELSKVLTFSINKDLKDEKGSNYVLLPNDVVTIFTQSGYQEQKQVQLNGEVMFPGTYVLSKGHERISDVLKRAGGLTANGFPGGAILIRPRGNSYRDKIVKENKIETLKKLSKDTSMVTDEIEKELQKTADIVGINLDKILKNPGSKEDLFLSENDVLEIPSMQQTVLVSGQVLYPVRLRYNGGSSFRNYVSMSGGFSSRALRKRSYIVYANGTAKDTKNFLFFHFYPKVKPGSELVIPVKETHKSVSVLEVVTIATSLTSMLLIISTLTK